MPQSQKIIHEKQFINNEWVTGSGDGHLEVIHKYTQEPLAAIPWADSKNMDAAIDAAKNAFETYRSRSAEERSACLTKLATLLEEKQKQFVDLIIAEAGKPRSYAQGEFNRALTTIRTAAAETLRFSGEVVNLDFDAGKGKQAFTRRFPIGVIGCITPFNFPLNLVLHKVAPALASGNTVVLKPGMQTPLTALALAELIKEAGFPEGAFNAIVCENEVAEQLVRDERIAMISFTGSDKVGWKLKEICGKKRITLELGGNAAVLVDESADLKGVAEKIAYGSFLYAGQICIAVQRIFVHENIYDDFVKELIAETQKMPVGDPNEEGTLVGPMISEKDLQRIDEWVREAKDAGAKVLCGGMIQDEKHQLYAPTLLTHSKDSMKVWKEEAFGPVALVEKVKDFEHGLEAVNNSRYGLQAGVYTNRLDHFRMAHETLDVGAVIMNGIPGFRVDSMPYGGIKDSGLGREGIKYAMQEMTEPRLMVY